MSKKNPNTVNESWQALSALSGKISKTWSRGAKMDRLSKIL